MKVYPINAKYKVLIVLLKLGGSGKYSDIDRMMRNSNLRFFIEQLRQEGFIEDRYEGNKHIIKLTEDGEKLAKRLMEAEEFVMMKIAQARGQIQ
ncbi:hypothetical protein YN1551_3194 (plasmid) [Sulfolobus islandicus Y.N.15.51]|jgi:predicted transcriptional regulator|uniref:ArnR1-like winged helix-turn-helix domain-containing protein n=1 Tax=Saccharolobus islandicus (strain Y.N.15.51 / Yellowstone \|nr:hypothetical protein [Sulfolobus islandicus]ACP50069.1 hypothetical protein YN1551_3194 [Sulfolobus islandicus Y.N.15.51]